jgi:hypothetical protein
MNDDRIHYLRIQNVRNLKQCTILAENMYYGTKDLHAQVNKVFTNNNNSMA